VALFAVRGCRGDLGLIPLMFFVLTAVLSSIGAGNIAGSALMAPLAMTMAQRVGIPPFLMAIVVAHGALAGALSPVSPTGIIADRLMREELALSGFEVRLYLYNLLANAAVGLGGYLLLGGWRLFGRKHVETAGPPVGNALRGVPAAANAPDGGQSPLAAGTWSTANVITLLAIMALIVGVIFFNVHVGMGQRIPWGVIVMVCGVTVLTSLLEKTGGLDRFAQVVARVSTPHSATGVIALLSGVLSVYSSTSGVVLPALLPMVPKLVSELGGGVGESGWPRISERAVLPPA
jgi:di/tricarboxylate transporter